MPGNSKKGKGKGRKAPAKKGVAEKPWCPWTNPGTPPPSAAPPPPPPAEEQIASSYQYPNYTMVDWHSLGAAAYHHQQLLASLPDSSCTASSSTEPVTPSNVTKEAKRILNSVNKKSLSKSTRDDPVITRALSKFRTDSHALDHALVDDGICP